VYAARPYYERQDSAFLIWYGAGYWNITTVLGTFPNGQGWYVLSDGPEGTYGPSAVYTGNPIVAAFV